MTIGPALLIPAMALVMAETALLYALVRLVDRFAPSHCLRERHDLALAAMTLVPLLMVLAVLPGRAVEGTLTTPVAKTVQLMAPAPLARPLRAGDTPAATPPTSSAPDERNPRHSNPALLASIALALWLAGSIILLVRLAGDLRALRRLLGDSRRLGRTGTLGLTGDLEVRSTEQIVSPMLAGLRSPTILVPRDFTLNPQAAPVLEHELAHARRGDTWTMLGQRLLIALFWWNLPLHLFCDHIARSREALCDRDAAVATGAPRQLAHALLNAAAAAARRPVARQHGLAAQAHGVALEERVQRLAAPDAARARAPVATLRMILPALGTAAYLLTPGLSVADTQASESADPSPPLALSSPALSSMALRSRENLPLYEAARRGDQARVSTLLERGFDPSAAAAGDGTPLMGAIRGGHLPVVRTLLAAGADPDVVAPGDGTALIAAARKDNRQAVRLLLQAGASPDIAVDGDGAALIAAAAYGRLEIIDDLLAAGADPNIAVSGDGAPLIAASLAGQLEATRRLLNAGADANGFVRGDETPLINAAQQGHLDVGKLLVAQGADVSLTVPTGRGDWRSPLSEAQNRGHGDFVAWLESLGAAHEPGRD